MCHCTQVYSGAIMNISTVYGHLQEKIFSILIIFNINIFYFLQSPFAVLVFMMAPLYTHTATHVNDKLYMGCPGTGNTLGITLNRLCRSMCKFPNIHNMTNNGQQGTQGSSIMTNIQEHVNHRVAMSRSNGSVWCSSMPTPLGQGHTASEHTTKQKKILI